MTAVLNLVVVTVVLVGKVVFSAQVGQVLDQVRTLFQAEVETYEFVS